MLRVLEGGWSACLIYDSVVDADYYAMLRDHFEQKLGLREAQVALDEHPQRVETLRGCQLVIAMVGKRWSTYASSGCTELRSTIEAVASALEVRAVVVPLLLGGAAMPDPAALPKTAARLCRLQAGKLSTTSECARFVEEGALVVRHSDLQHIDRVLEEELTRIHKQREAVADDVEATKAVIRRNIERSFNPSSGKPRRPKRRLDSDN